MDDTEQQRTEAPGPEAPGPEAPGPEAPPPPGAASISGWVVPPTTAPPTSPLVARRILIVAWIAAVIIVGFFAVLRAAPEGGSAGYRVGYQIGGFIAPFLFAAIARWVVVRLRRGRPDAPVGVLRSQWVPLGAIALAVLNGISGLSALTPPASVDPSTALRIGPGYTLREADPTVAQQVADAFGGEEAARAYVIREIAGDDGSISFVLIFDGRLRAGDDMTEVARGLGEGSSLPARVDTIMGRPVAVAAGSGIALASWVEEPLMLSVLAGDEPTLRDVVESIISTPR